MKRIILILLSIVFSCSFKIADEDDMSKYYCTKKQYEVVMIQTNYCKHTTTYASSNCYDIAIKRNCKFIGDKKNDKHN